MSTIIDNGFRLHQVLTKWVQKVALLSHSIGGPNDLVSVPPKPSAKYASIVDLAPMLRTSQPAKLKSSSDEKGFHRSSLMVLFSFV